MIDLLLSYDVAIARAAIDFTAAHPKFAQAVRAIVDTPETKGLIPVLCFWYLWISPRAGWQQTRMKLVAVLFVSLVAIAVGRLLALNLMFRARPFASAAVMGDDVVTQGRLVEWSAMPSDHAVAFVALATGILLVSRGAGILLLLHAALIVCGSRVFAGLHFPADVLVGGAIGLVLAVALVPVAERWFAKASLQFPRTYNTLIRPEIGYLLLGVLTFELATMFDGIRRLGATLFVLLM
ncbi:undecaprenyl-diphosphatase [Yoonia tamlensis]|uniref:Undecaprenyl-diphosphatase n=1 Tax=Yoonia tamlensis TaxID=390270 RepID=A0A1I6H9K1_9RHOB|nr:phosphatase PAP2 family protein [Yoonia tamlensis]SFR51175.1 undecaprenyl-diphosphatase [Yoonia tamlensis]